MANVYIRVKIVYNLTKRFVHLSLKSCIPKATLLNHLTIYQQFYALFVYIVTHSFLKLTKLVHELLIKVTPVAVNLFLNF